MGFLQIPWGFPKDFQHDLQNQKKRQKYGSYIFYHNYASFCPIFTLIPYIFRILFILFEFVKNFAIVCLFARFFAILIFQFLVKMTFWSC